MTSTKALVVDELGAPFRMASIHLDAIQPDEALIEIHATGICHTDNSCANGNLPATAPSVLGHEGAGIVLQAGAHVTEAAVGDHVLLSFAFCQSCVHCRSGHPSYCTTFAAMNFGGQRSDGTCVATRDLDQIPLYSSFFGQSSFARRAVVHRSCLVKVDPATTDLKLFCPLGCGLVTGAGAVFNTLDVQPGKSMAVFGCGSVGLSALMAARIRGAAPLIAVDVQPSRLALARTLGATHTVQGTDADVVAQIQAIAPPNGVDYAGDFSGVPAVVETMIACLGTRGIGASVGSPPPDKTVAVKIFKHIIGGRQYRGCCQGDAVPADIIPYLVKQHADGNYPIDKIIRYYPVNEYKKAFADMKAGVTIKPVLVWTDEKDIAVEDRV